MRPLRLHRKRFLEWLAHRDVAWANERIRALRDWRDRRADDADRHGGEADKICPPAGPGGEPPAEAAPPEWEPRLSDRGGHTDLHPPPGA